MALPKYCTPGLYLELLQDLSWKMRPQFNLFPFIMLAHMPLQTFLYFNAAYVVIK